MSEPTPRPVIASSPISMLLFAHALCSDTQEAIRGWHQYLSTLGRAYEIFLDQKNLVGPAQRAEVLMPSSYRFLRVATEGMSEQQHADRRRRDDRTWSRLGHVVRFMGSLPTGPGYASPRAADRACRWRNRSSSAPPRASRWRDNRAIRPRTFRASRST